MSCVIALIVPNLGHTMGDRTISHKIWEWLGRVAVLFALIGVGVAIAKYFLLPNTSLEGQFRYDRLQYPEFSGSLPPSEVALTDRGLQLAPAISAASTKSPTPSPSPTPYTFPLLQLQGRWLGFVANRGNVALSNVTVEFPQPPAVVRVQRSGYAPEFFSNYKMLDLGTLQPGERVAIGAWERFVPQANPLNVFIANEQEYFDPAASPYRGNPMRLTHNLGFGKVTIVNYGANLMDAIRSPQGLAALFVVAIPAGIATVLTFILFSVFGRQRRSWRKTREPRASAPASDA